MPALVTPRRVVILTPNKGGGVQPPYPAPDGFAWKRVTSGGVQVTYQSQPVVYLARAA